MSAYEPGLDRHLWESEFEALDEELRADPGEALPELLDLVDRMLAAGGYDTAAAGAIEAPEVDAGLTRARELVQRLEAGEQVPNDDAFQAAAELRSIYRSLAQQPEVEAGADFDRSADAE
jgi:hypothetical protein